MPVFFHLNDSVVNLWGFKRSRRTGFPALSLFTLFTLNVTRWSGEPPWGGIDGFATGCHLIAAARNLYLPQTNFSPSGFEPSISACVAVELITSIITST